MNFIRYGYGITFWFLFALSAFFILQRKFYYNSRWLHSTHFFTGKVLELQQYFIAWNGLRQENQMLLEENVSLKNQIEQLRKSPQKPLENFNYIAAHVVRNSYKKINNILIIDKGALDGVAVDMGVVNSRGIVGIVDKVSGHYAAVLSVLNHKIKINAGFVNNNYFGSLSWEKGDFRKMMLTELEADTPVNIGDTIITAGMSQIFPKGIRIGIVSDIAKGKNEIKAAVTLFNDMRNLQTLQIIHNNEKQEIRSLTRE